MWTVVTTQLREVFARTIEAGVAVRQNYPSITGFGSVKAIGNLQTSVALRNVAYSDTYMELVENNQFHIMLPDGGVMLFQYRFNCEGQLLKHRLCYFPSPQLPTVEEAPELYHNDQLYADILLDRIVRFPVRFDYDPESYRPRFHPQSHLTLGQFENCRIPVSCPVSPNDFLKFVLLNFYHLAYRRHLNKFEKRSRSWSVRSCLTEHERGLPFLTF